jgi:DNA-binding response OmpR family regulator
MRILVVEDEREIEGLLRQSLVKAGYQVDAVEDGRTAALYADRNRYDGMIVDLGLPDQDGIDLILQLRRSGVKSPVLILSAWRSVDDRVRVLEQGSDDYLIKPFAVAELSRQTPQSLAAQLATNRGSHGYPYIGPGIGPYQAQGEPHGRSTQSQPARVCSPLRHSLRIDSLDMEC